MSQRGRGCLSIAPSDNAFYQTTTGEIGLRPNENPGSTFRRTFTETSADRTTTDGTGAGAGMDAGAATGNFAFLYTRESDKIGAMVRKSNNMQMTHTLPRKPSFGTRFMDSGLTQVPPKPSAEELLSYYRQGTKEEDPRYTTSTVRLKQSCVCLLVRMVFISPPSPFHPRMSTAKRRPH